MILALSDASFLFNLLHLVKYTLSSLKPETLASCFYRFAHSGCLPMSLWGIEVYSLSFISSLCMNPICSVSLPDRTMEAGLWSLLEFTVCWVLLSLLPCFHSPLQMLGIWRKLINQWVRESVMLRLDLLNFSGPRGAVEGLLSQRQNMAVRARLWVRALSESWPCHLKRLASLTIAQGFTSVKWKFWQCLSVGFLDSLMRVTNLLTS